jgi:hypothetical protein
LIFRILGLIRERENFALERQFFPLAPALAAAANSFKLKLFKLKIAAAKGGEGGFFAIEDGIFANEDDFSAIEGGSSAPAPTPTASKGSEGGFSTIEDDISANEDGFSALAPATAATACSEDGFSALVFIIVPCSPGPSSEALAAADSPRIICRPPTVKIQP